MNLQQVGERLQNLVANLLERQKTVYNIVLGVFYEDTDYSWSGAVGMADPTTGRPMRAETPFLIASVTKMVTATAIMMLQERGHLQLDDPISKYLPGNSIRGLHHFRGRDYTESLTIRHLISQTSGLPDYFMQRPKGGMSVLNQILTEGDRAWDLNDVVTFTSDHLPAKFAPAAFKDGATDTQAKAHYSDTNYKLLGAIIESTTEKTLQTVFEEFFFEPLNLTQTYLYGQPNKAVVEEPAHVFFKHRPLVVDKLMRSHGPEGGIVSTVDDTLRFGKTFASGSLFIHQDTLATMQQWNNIFFPLQYGYGLMRFKLPRILMPFGYNPEFIGHSGSSGSFLYYCPDLNLYLTGTINQMALQNVPFQLMIKVAQLFKQMSN